MNIIISSKSMIPIYEQIIDQIKKMIVDGQLIYQQPLPSVRQLANELKISALTVKKAYDLLEEAGFIITVHGKGSYVNQINTNFIKEENIKIIENSLYELLVQAKNKMIQKDELEKLFKIIVEDVYD